MNVVILNKAFPAMGVATKRKKGGECPPLLVHRFIVISVHQPSRLYGSQTFSILAHYGIWFFKITPATQRFLFASFFWKAQGIGYCLYICFCDFIYWQRTVGYLPVKEKHTVKKRFETRKQVFKIGSKPACLFSKGKLIPSVILINCHNTTRSLCRHR